MTSEIQPTGTAEDLWCILRTSGPATLGLVKSLNSAGLGAWTPRTIVRRRRPRSKVRVDREAPILPTFVFAPSTSLGELRAALNQPINPFPAFSIFRFSGRIPLISAASLATLHELEEREAEAYRQRVQGEKRAAERRSLRSERVTQQVNDTVTVKHGAFAGLTGIVEDVRTKEARVNFGAGMSFTVAAWQLESVEVEDAHGR